MPVSANWLAVEPSKSKVLTGAFESAHGQIENKSVLTKPLFFDLASLTKVILTSTLLVDLLETEFAGDWDRFLNLDLRKELPELALVPDWVDLRLRSLWEHRSGLPPHFLLSGGPRQKFEGPRSVQWRRVVGRLCEELQKIVPQTAETRYSDVGFWPLGLFLEKQSGHTLQDLWRVWKKKHALPAHDLLFHDEVKTAVVETESRHPAGEVNDDNAYWMHAVAPHAGLFGTVHGVEAWIKAVQAWVKRNPSLQFWTHRQESSRSRFWLGWDTASGEADSQAGSHFASKAVLGHLGWTGTAFWWDTLREGYGILLTNRVHPQHSEESQNWMRATRRQFFSDLWQSKIEARWLP